MNCWRNILLLVALTAATFAQQLSESTVEEIVTDEGSGQRETADAASPPAPVISTYSATCSGHDKGNVIHQIISQYDQQLGIRTFRSLCSNLLDIKLQHPAGLEWYKDRWDWTRRRIDMPEPINANDLLPSNWIGGCKDMEVMVGINSYVIHAVRRYEFICVEYLTVRVKEESCRLLSPTRISKNFTIKSNSISKDRPYAFRKVRTSFDTRTRDRRFEFEFCELYTVAMWPTPRVDECRFRRVTTHADEIEKIREKIFAKHRVQDVHDCAKICTRHPYCSSFTWSPGLTIPAALSCELSYENFSEAFCKSATIFETGFSHRRRYLSKDDQLLGIPCFDCPTEKKLSGIDRLVNAAGLQQQ